jgi:hypothetical protein
VRRALAFVLLASSLKLLGVPTLQTGIALAVLALGAPVVWMLVRRRHGFPALASRRNRNRVGQPALVEQGTP